MHIRTAMAADAERWAMMRHALWPESSVEEHRQEVIETVENAPPDRMALLATDEAGAICGFAEASLRRDYVNGCDTTPVAFIEGIYVEPSHQSLGVGRRLCAAVEIWGREQGCRELASDALLENTNSHAFHKAIGFEETERVVYFRKRP